jgi:voltage-gated potassium channel
MRSTADRLRVALGMVAAATIFGTVGYLAFGFTLLDALYQTITTITTVGRHELTEFGTGLKIFTIVVGVSTVLYPFTLVVQLVVEGQVREFVGGRRLDRQLRQMSTHTIVCGRGRVGAAVAHDLRMVGQQVVVVDQNSQRIQDLPFPTVVGDATLDDTLKAAGIHRAKAPIAALDGDADNLFVTLSGRDLVPGLFIVARAQADESIPKLQHAGAHRVVNPQELGAARMPPFVASPHVAEFLDVVMHDRSLEFQIREFTIPADSRIAHKTLGEANLSEENGALALALRSPDGRFTTNPPGDTVIEPDQVIIAVGTDEDVDQLTSFATAHTGR